MNLRTRHGTLESKLQTNRMQGMLGFVVHWTLLRAGICGSRERPGMLGIVVSATSHSATSRHLRFLESLAAGAGPWSLCRSEANPPLGQTLGNKSE